MHRDKPIGKLSRETLKRAWASAALLLVLALAGAWFLVSSIPHRVVLASGLQDGLYHQAWFLHIRYSCRGGTPWPPAVRFRRETGGHGVSPLQRLLLNVEAS